MPVDGTVTGEALILYLLLNNLLIGRELSVFGVGPKFGDNQIQMGG